MSDRIMQEFVDEIKSLTRDIEEIKTLQSFGPDSIVGYLTYSSNQYDLTTSLSLGQEERTFLLTLEHETAQNGAIIQLSAFISTLPNVMGSYIPPWANGPDVLLRIQEVAPHEGDKTFWYVSVRNGTAFLDPVTAYVKFFFNGTDTGSFSAVEV